jgi:hypothetical protein
MNILGEPHLSPGAKLMAGFLIAHPDEGRNPYLAQPERMADALGATSACCRRWFCELVRAGFPTAPRSAATEHQRIRYRAAQSGHIYVLKVGDIYKIGRSRQVKQRLHMHQDSCPFPIEIVMHARVHDHELIEAGLHRAFADKRVRTEWYRLDEHDLADIREVLANAKA